MTETVTLYHNPKCSTSRNALALLREHGIEPQVVEYLKTPPSRDDLAKLAQQIDGTARALLRSKQAEYSELGLDNPDLSDEALLDALAAHPILLNRPVVASARGVVVARPIERALEVVDAQR